MFLFWVIFIVPFIANNKLKSINQISFGFIDQNSNFEKQNLITQTITNENILYVDDDIICVNKPFNLQTVPGYLDSFSLATILQIKYNINNIEHMTPHRLDYQTSGVVVITRNLNSLRNMQKQFRERVTIYKKYSAIISGIPNSYEGEIDLPIDKDKSYGPPLQTIDFNGKYAHTNWKIEEIGKNQTKVQLYPSTGRTHQLRLHMAAIGHPILGDFFYSPTNLYLRSNRLCLHAQELRFLHPNNKKPMKIIAPSPFHVDEYT